MYIKILLLLAVIFQIYLCSPVFALSDDFSLEKAKNIISTNETHDEFGNDVKLYSNLNACFNALRFWHPELTNLEIAKIFFDFLGQDFQSLPENKIERILNYEQIASSTWKSEDGFLEITKNYAVIEKKENYTSYDVWVIAKWLKDPEEKGMDCFTFCVDGTWDDDFESCGYIFQKYKCIKCGLEKEINSYVTENVKLSDNVFLESGQNPNLFFSEKIFKCPECNKNMDRICCSIYLDGTIKVATGNTLKLSTAYSYLVSKNQLINLSIGWSGYPEFFSNDRIKTVYVDYENSTKKYDEAMRTKDRNNMLLLVVVCLVFMLVVKKYKLKRKR